MDVQVLDDLAKACAESLSRAAGAGSHIERGAVGSALGMPGKMVA